MVHEIARDCSCECSANLKGQCPAISQRTPRINRRTTILALCLPIAMLATAAPAFATITMTSESATITAGGTDFFTFPGSSQTITDNALFTTFNHSLQNVVHGHNGTELDEFASQ